MRFSQSNVPRIFELKKALGTLTQDTLSISGYYTKFKMLWDDLSHASSTPKCTCSCVCKAKQQMEQADEVMKVTQFLMGLNEMYTNIRGQLLMLNLMPPLTTVLSLLQQEERQRSYVPLAQSTVESSVLMSKSRFNQSGQTDNKKYAPKRNNLHCTHYNGKNHTRERCFHLIGFPPKGKSTGGAKGYQIAGNKFVAQVATTSSPVANSHSDDKTEVNSQVTEMTNNSLSNAQYQQLLSLLNHSQISQPSSDTPQSGLYSEDNIGDW